MREIIILIGLSYSFSGLSFAQFNHTDSLKISTCEPISYEQDFLPMEAVERHSENQGFKKWILAKGKKTIRKIAAGVKRTKKQLKYHIVQWAIKTVVPPAVMPTVFAKSDGEENKQSIGFWSLMTYLASLLFLVTVPGFGLLVLLASIVMAMIGTVRDKNGLAILVLVLGFVTLLFLLILALFESLFIFFLFA
ncbi:MAG: hypothetical protein GVX96_05790 [Bacteroidetes bacterium]|jgi:hypothetical protein|nr:hypothetical protein [Bacteroidota bacterium]